MKHLRDWLWQEDVVLWHPPTDRGHLDFLAASPQRLPNPMTPSMNPE